MTKVPLFIGFSRVRMTKIPLWERVDKVFTESARKLQVLV